MSSWERRNKGVARQFATAEQLRIQFRKWLQKGRAKNAELDPQPPREVVSHLEAGETVQIRVDSTKGTHYWFTDGRLLGEDVGDVRELLRFKDVVAAHWMFKDLWESRLKHLNTGAATARFKQDHFDRLEIELQGRCVALEGLDQAYIPILRFFQWIA